MKEEIRKSAVVALIFGAVGGLIAGLFAGFSCDPVTSELIARWVFGFVVALFFGSVVGAAFGLFHIPYSGLGTGLAIGLIPILIYGTLMVFITHLAAFFDGAGVVNFYLITSGVICFFIQLSLWQFVLKKS